MGSSGRLGPFSGDSGGGTTQKPHIEQSAASTHNAQPPSRADSRDEFTRTAHAGNFNPPKNTSTAWGEGFAPITVAE